MVGFHSFDNGSDLLDDFGVALFAEAAKLRCNRFHLYIESRTTRRVVRKRLLLVAAYVKAQHLAVIEACHNLTNAIGKQRRIKSAGPATLAFWENRHDFAFA